MVIKIAAKNERSSPDFLRLSQDHGPGQWVYLYCSNQSYSIYQDHNDAGMDYSCSDIYSSILMRKPNVIYILIRKQFFYWMAGRGAMAARFLREAKLWVRCSISWCAVARSRLLFLE